MVKFALDFGRIYLDLCKVSLLDVFIFDFFLIS